MFRKPDTEEAEKAASKHDEATRILTSLAPCECQAVEPVASEPQEEEERGNGLARFWRRLTGKE